VDAQLQALLDMQAITEVLHRYCRAIDRGDRELIRSVYHPDAEDYHGIYNGPISGLFEMPGKTKGTYTGTSHTVSNILIELADDRAHVESYLDAIHQLELDGEPWTDFLRCRYVDGFERRDGEWRIARRVVIYDWVESRPRAAENWCDREGGEYILGQRGHDDPTYVDRERNLRASTT
jgi:hypothetical protein